MEPHPVPQNIIDVEFKLFGAFSLRQFGKVLIGCMVGVFIYLIPFIPLIAKIPVILIAVGSGVLTAVIPNFGTWMSGFIKALIVAPRYVWVKEPTRSDVLEETKSKLPTVKAVISTADDRRDSLDARAISEAIQEKDDVLEDFIGGSSQGVQKDNFNTMYNKSYDDDLKAIQPLIDKQDEVQVQSKDFKTPTQKILNQEEILRQIEALRIKLSEATRNGNKDEETEVLNQINDLYSHYKLIKNNGMEVVKPQNLNMKQFANSALGKNIFGLVVTKSDRPVADAEIVMTNLETKESYIQMSAIDGKFASSAKIPLGEYDIVVNHPNLKFHKYKIQVGEQRLPAFKFRER